METDVLFRYELKKEKISDIYLTVQPFISYIYTVYECLAIVLNYDKPVYKDIIQIKHLDDSITSEKTKK